MNAGRSGFERLAIVIALVIGVAALVLVTIAPMTLGAQAAFGAVTCAAFLLLSRVPGRFISLTLAVLAFAVSTRYIFWRLNDTLDFDTPLDAAFGYGLVLAELYAWVVLLLGNVQTVWPLSRAPVLLPDDMESWPTVDVFIPTYNEPLSVVRATVFAAQRLDYPKHKLFVHLLDDSRRKEFRDFAARIGVNYIARPTNEHAKSGNLNHAMQRTHGEIVCVFDCDHAVTRSFLQLCVGWFLKDPKLALVQTPHTFHSPDPFERNLEQPDVPTEGQLFYGLVQEGNDLWNATLFCGSCAALRRSALEDVGGFAVETVTEDAHTALKMARRGWNSAYISLPMASGLATERLALHVGQRARWARGMTQIFRLDNPLFGRGLTLGQRLCYLNAMLHFFFGLPRVVFLTAPLPYLMLNLKIIHSSGLTIAAYALPHIILSVAANSRIQGRYRPSFWSEIYEATIAFHILVVTTVTFFSPRRGKFNVTEKGGLVERDYFDFRILRPHIVATSLLAVGVTLGLINFYFVHDQDEQWTILLNIAWSIYNLVTMLCVLAVGYEHRQMRQRARIALKLPCTVHLPDGERLAGETSNLSMSGAAVAAMLPVGLPKPPAVVLQLPDRRGSALFPARIVAGEANQLRLEFDKLTIDEERRLAGIVLGRADSSIGWTEHEADHPLRALASIGATAFGFLFAAAFRRRRVAAALLALTFGLPAAPWLGLSQPAAAETSAVPVPRPDAMKILPFRRLSGEESLWLRGLAGETGVSFALRRDAVVTAAHLHLVFAHSDGLPSGAKLEVLLNGNPAGSIDLGAGATSADLTLDADTVGDDNHLGFRIAGVPANACDARDDVWVKLSGESAVMLAAERQPIANDLSLLPLPFFDRHESGRLTLPFVFVTVDDNAGPAPQTLEAAGALASWFGAQAAWRSAKFPVLFDHLPKGDAVVFATSGANVSGLSVGAVRGPTLAMTDNPTDAGGKLLLVLGGDASEVKHAARGLALGASLAIGPVSRVGDSASPLRRPYDAANWISEDRPVPLGMLTNPDGLKGHGLDPQPIVIDFISPPDYLNWSEAKIPLRLSYYVTPVSPLDLRRSKLNVSVNGHGLRALPLASGSLFETGDGHGTAEVEIPAYLLSGHNRIELQFGLVEAGHCIAAATARAITAGISPESSIDLTQLRHFILLPNLAAFANAGFPFSRMADLSEAGVVLPDAMRAQDVAAYLDVMGLVGDATGAPATGVKLVRASDIATVADRDLLVIGRFGMVPTILGESARVSIQSDGIDVKNMSLVERVTRQLSWASGRDLPSDVTRWLAEAGTDVGAILGFASPYAANRTVVVISARSPRLLEDTADVLLSHERLIAVQGDTVLVSPTTIRSFRIEPVSEAGIMPRFVWLRWKLSDSPLGIALTALAAAAVLAGAICVYAREKARRRLDGRPR